jgi:hypothetical protein
VKFRIFLAVEREMAGEPHVRDELLESLVALGLGLPWGTNFASSFCDGLG